MDIVFIVGSIAAFFIAISFLPQVLKAHQTKHTKDLSLTMLFLFAAGIGMWLIYGILTFSIPMIIGNSATLSMAFYLIYLKIKHG
jgi:MtN3 and saliva related transmembrane protein